MSPDFFCASCWGANREDEGCGCEGQLPLADLIDAREALTRLLASGPALGAKATTELLSSAVEAPEAAAPATAVAVGAGVRFLSDRRHLLCVLEEPVVRGVWRSLALPAAERAARTSGSAGDVELSVHAFDSHRQFALVKSLALSRLCVRARARWRSVAGGLTCVGARRVQREWRWSRDRRPDGSHGRGCVGGASRRRDELFARVLAAGARAWRYAFAYAVICMSA